MLVALALVAIFVPIHASGTAEVEPIRVEAGPVLAGDSVVWAESNGATFRVRSGRPNRPTQTRFDAAPPSDEHTWSVAALAASPERVALLRRSTFCRRGDVTTVFPCVHGRQVLAGLHGRVMRVVASTRPCLLFSPLSEEGVDVVGRTIVAAESYCRGERGPARRRLVRYDATRRVVLRDEPMNPSACCGGVRAAGRFVVWASDALVLLYDLSARRVVRRVVVGHGFVQAVAVQPDGKFAVLLRRVRSATDALQLRWFDSNTASHTLPVTVRGSGAVDLEFAADRIVVERKVGGGSELAIVDLRGRTRPLVRFGSRFRRAGEFDFDGVHVTWASERLISSRLDCPPSPSLRPCFWRDSGIRAVWLADIRRRPLAPRLVVRERFADLARIGN